MTHDRHHYHAELELALYHCERALTLARANGYRQDCLGEATRSLRGAIVNVDYEDAEAAKKRG